MRLIVSQKEKRFYQDHQGLEIDNLINESTLSAIENALASQLPHRDLFRNQPIWKQFLLKKSFLSVVCQLCNTNPLRLAFDQLLTPSDAPHLDTQTPIYQHYAFQGLIIGFILCLTPFENASFPFPKERGNIVFFPMDAQLSFDLLLDATSGQFLFAAYGQENLCYIKQEKDPQCHYLKQYGYGFGDKLTNHTHPLVFI